MEPPSKRPRFSFTQDIDPEDEADWDTAAEDNVQGEPGADAAPINLEEARARNDQRLKSIFESIFAKYEKDFTEVGDEIDLQSGRIIVNNGHLQRMEGEDDTGEKQPGWLAQLSTPAEEEEEEEEEENENEDRAEDENGYDGYRPENGETQKWSDVEDGDDDEDDDDNSSVDSLLDSALSVNLAQSSAPSKKAMSPVETAGGLDRVHSAVACSHTTTTATTSKHELVDPKWRVPDIQSATFSSWVASKDPPNNKKKPIHPPTHPSDKTTATTATTAALAHSVSPPGGRSLWAVPLPGRPRKINTDAPGPKKKKKDRPAAKQTTGIGSGIERDKEEETDKKAIPAKNGKVVEHQPAATPTRSSATKLKPYSSSPMIASNWSSLSSFLDGGHGRGRGRGRGNGNGNGNGSDSDDPLHEYQPSPTPTSTTSVIRGRHATTPNRPQTTTTRLQSVSQSPSQSRCNGCRRLFPGNEEHVLHLRSVLASGSPDGLHDGEMVRRILDKIDYSHANVSARRDSDSYGSTRSTSSLEAYESPPPHPPPHLPAAAPPPEPSKPSKPVNIQDTDTDTNTNRKKRNHRARARAATPDEAKLIITMRHVHRKPWKEILDHFPEKRLSNLIQWNQLHWTERRARPPPSSGPWSLDERGRLSVIKDEQGLSWAAIRKRLPGRTTVEIEFELLRLWVGEGIWNGHGQAETEAEAEPEAAAAAAAPGRIQQTDGGGDLDGRPVGDKSEIPDSRETSLGLSDQEDSHGHGHGHTQRTQLKSNSDSFGILYEDQPPFDSIEYDDDNE